VRLYRVAPHCAEAPLYLVAKAVAGGIGANNGGGNGGGGNGGGGNGGGGNGGGGFASGPAAAADPPVPQRQQRRQSPQLWRALDCRGAFVVVAPLQHPAALAAAAAAAPLLAAVPAPARPPRPPAPGCWVWRGSACPRALASAAARAAAQLARYEGAPSPAAAPVAQGREPPALLAALGWAEAAAAENGGNGGSDGGGGGNGGGGALARRPSQPGASPLGSAVAEVDAYTADYELYALAAAARGEE
jgi:hypothetical protein